MVDFLPTVQSRPGEKPKVILLHPDVGHLDTLRTSPSLPLSLLHAAAFLAREFETHIIDMRLDPDWKKHLRQLLGRDTILAGATSYTGPMIRPALEMSRFVKTHSDVPVVWGGIHASLLPEQTLADENVDMVIQGEGEIALWALARALRDGTSFDKVQGLYYKQDGQSFGHPPGPFIDLNTVPELPYHLVDVQKYLPLYMGSRSFYFQSSRGCPFGCTYCFNTAFNKHKWRSLSAEKTIERIAAVKDRFDIGDVYFVDDNFFIDIDRSKRIMSGLAEIGIPWQVQGVDIISLQKMDDEFLKELERSGCRRITIGVESGSERIRRLMKKKGQVSDIVECIRRIKNYNIIVFCSFLTGVPTETVEELKETVKLLLTLLEENPNVRNSPIYNYTPYPGTEMYHLAVEQGFVPPKDLKSWSTLGRWDLDSFEKNSPPRRVWGKKNLQVFEYLYFTSLFLDKKTNEYPLPRPLKLLIDAYRPIARFRVRNLFFSFMIEKYFSRAAQWLIGRGYLLKRLSSVRPDKP